MPLLDHLGELRRRLTIMIVSVLITAIVVYEATPVIIDVLLDPIRPFLPGGQLSVLTALGGFTVRFKVAIFAGIIVCTPILVWEIMAFFLPALKPNERRWVIPTVAALIVLFFLGMVFCYFIILKTAFGWLYEQSSDFAAVVAQAEDYISIIMLLEIGFGVAFELPLVIFYLTIFHIVPYKTLRSGWRYVYVAGDNVPHVCGAYHPVRALACGRAPGDHRARGQAGPQVGSRRVPRALGIASPQKLSLGT